MHTHNRLQGCCARAARGPFALPGTTRKYERSLPFQFQHLRLELSVSLDEKMVSGHATLDFTRAASDAGSLHLDAIAFDISKVEVDSGDGFKLAAFDYDGETIVVTVGRRIKQGRVRVRYKAKPRAGLYFLAPDDKVKDRPTQVWSQCQDEDARHWFPCHDKPHVKLTAEFKISVPAKYSVLCNGDLISEKTKTLSGKLSGKGRGARQRRWTTFHYKLQHKLPSYLVTLVVGEFDRVNDRSAVLASGREVPVSYWVPKGRKADALRSFGETPNMIEQFSALTKVEYPYSRYTQVVVSDFIFGGMENTTATTMHEYIMLDERAALDVDSNYLVAHELAHHWFGDWVTCKDWPHAWLNEGFATFFEHIERRRRLGDDEYLLGLEGDLTAYLNEANSDYRRAIVCKDYSEPIDLFDRHLYEKGSLVLHLLSQELGEDAFWSAIGKYLDKHAAGHAVTDDLRQAFEAEAGRSLDRFFDEWVLTAGHPGVKAKASYSDKQLLIQFEQTQKRMLELCFEAQVMDEHGKLHQLSVHNDEKHTTLTLSLPKPPLYVAIDPQLRLLGKLDIELPNNWLMSQLERGSTGRIRRQAAQLLGSKPDFRCVAKLGEALRKESEAWFVRAACAQSLGQQASEDALEQLLQGTRCEHPKVRTAVAEAIGQFTDPKTSEALLGMLKNEPSYLSEAAATKALGKTRSLDHKGRLTQQLSRPSWADVIACAAVDGLAELDFDDRIDVLKKHTEYGHPTRVRRRAIAALGRVGEGKAVRQHLERLLDDGMPHLREDVISALLQLDDKRVRGALNRRLALEQDGRVVRSLKEALRSLGSKDTNTELSNKLTRLEREINELRGKLAQLSPKNAKKGGASSSPGGVVPPKTERKTTTKPRKKKR